MCLVALSNHAKHCLQVFCVIFCGQIRIRRLWDGERMIEESPSLLDQKLFPNSLPNTTWILYVGHTRYAQLIGLFPHVQLPRHNASLTKHNIQCSHLVILTWRSKGSLRTLSCCFIFVYFPQVVEDGYEFFAKRQLVTLFSAPNYCGEFDNAGAMMSVDETLMCSFQV